MTVEELFRALSYGELSNLAVAVDGTGTIKPSQHGKVLHHANEALTRIYSRFLIEEKSVILQVFPDVTRYPLLTRCAVSVWAEPDDDQAHLIDTIADPFLGDVIQVLNVFNEYGAALPLNDPKNRDAILTPNATTLVLPYSTENGFGLGLEADDLLDVVYQAKHPVLVATADLDQEILLPLEFHEALTAYIAAKIYGNMNTADAAQVSMQHQARFEAVCNDAERAGQYGAVGQIQSDKFERQGWV